MLKLQKKYKCKVCKRSLFVTKDGYKGAKEALVCYGYDCHAVGPQYIKVKGKWVDKQA